MNFFYRVGQIVVDSINSSSSFSKNKFYLLDTFFAQTIIIIFNMNVIGYANIPNYKDIELNKKIYKIYLLSILSLETYWQM